MKLKLKSICLLFISIAIFHVSCKKSASTPADPALAPKDVASQVALNISQSLFGGLGFNLSGGLNAPSSFAVHTKGKVLQSLTNPDCGLVVDTTLTYTGDANGGTATIAGHIKFSFMCTNDVVSGFSTVDNLNIILKSPELNLTYKVDENFTILSLHPDDPNSNLSLNGSLNSSANYQFNTGTKRSGTETFDYTLKSLIISQDAGVISGTATFNTVGTGPKGVWNYQGTITFLGNQMATVSISGKTYNVNLETGVVS